MRLPQPQVAHMHPYKLTSYRRWRSAAVQELIEKHNVLDDDLPKTRSMASEMITYYRSVVQDVSFATKWVASAAQVAICKAMEIDHASITSQEEYDGVFAAFLSTKTAEADDDKIMPALAESDAEDEDVPLPAVRAVPLPPKCS